MPETLGDRIRAARLRYGMSQAELARRVGVSTNAMNAMELNRVRNPGVLQVKAIAQVLGVSADYLLGLREHEEEAASVAVGVA